MGGLEKWQCEKYYEKIDRDSFTIGASIPDTMEINDKELPLKKLAFDISKDGSVPDEYDMDLMEIKRNLRRERNSLSEKLEECEVSTEEEAERIVDQVQQIDRTLSVISDTDDVDIDAEVKRNKAMKEKKWRAFLKKIKGDE